MVMSHTALSFLCNKNTLGHLLYLCPNGGITWPISKEAAATLDLMAARCLARDSHKINTK